LHACESDRGVPGGDAGDSGGLVPWEQVFSALHEINFDGNVLFESYNSSLDNCNFAYSRGMFHHVCDDGDEFVRTGLKFLRSHPIT
jgi:D-psicose/D-tagatose/L-ribulose 3-epimerase